MTITKPSASHIEALIAAQKEIESVGKDGKNPYFKSDYATLNATIEACKKILNDHGFVILQPIDSDENGVYVCTTLIHITGETISSRMRIEQAKTNDPQAQGSAITYARRYALKSLLCMSDEDDDGAKASGRVEAPKTTAPVSGLTMKCAIHNVPMTERISKKTGKPYFAHVLNDKSFCFGKSQTKKEPQPENEYTSDYFYSAEEVAESIPF